MPYGRLRGAYAPFPHPLPLGPALLYASVYTSYFENDDTVELYLLEHLWNHNKMFERGVARANDCFHSARPGGIKGIYF